MRPKRVFLGGRQTVLATTSRWLCLLLVVAVVFVVASPQGRSDDSFWNGSSISSWISEEAQIALHGVLMSDVIPELQGGIEDEDYTGVRGTTYWEPHKTWGDYTLINSLRGATDPDGTRWQAFLIDMNGNQVGIWPMQAQPAKMLPNGHIVGGLSGTYFGGRALVEMDFCANVIKELEVPDLGPDYEVRLGLHHDFALGELPAGYFAGRGRRYGHGDEKTLMVANHYVNPELTRNPPGPGPVMVPFPPGCPPFLGPPFPQDPAGNFPWLFPLPCGSPDPVEVPMLDDTMVEFDAGDNPVWEWHAWEHFEQMGFDEKAKEAIVSSRLLGAPFAPYVDWTHQNAASYVGPNKWYYRGDERFHPDNIIVDFRSLNLIAIIARHPGEHNGEAWEEGDIVWKVGPQYGAGHPEQKLGTIIGPHQAHVIPKGLPGAGNILVFDNGGFAGYGSLIQGLPGMWPNQFRDYSRVIEFDPRTLETVWKYEQPIAVPEGEVPTPNTRRFFSGFVSGMQRLPNGNTMITEGFKGRIFEVTRDGKVVWEYFSNLTGNAGIPIGQFGVYRAYRVPKRWIPRPGTCEVSGGKPPRGKKQHWSKR